MKTRIISLFCITLLFLSCFGNKKNVVEGGQQSLGEIKQHGYDAPVTVEQMIDFINKNESRIIRDNAEITFISKANFGIHGGDNWIVLLNFSGYSLLNYHLLLVYMINNNSIEKRYILAGYDLEEQSRFDIMRGIPGTRIGNLASSIGDFNDDGIDEVFHYSFGGSAALVVIDVYNAEKDDFVPYCEIPFRLIDRDNGPAPVEFITYKGMYGFKVYYFVYELGFSPTYHPDPDPKTNKWFFYTWNTEQKKYIEIGEVE